MPRYTVQYSRYEHAGAATEEHGSYSNNMADFTTAWPPFANMEAVKPAAVQTE